MATQLPLFKPASTWRPPTTLPSLKGVKRLGLDTETCDPRLDELGPGARRGEGFIAGLSLAIEGGPKYYFPVRHEGGGNLDPGLVFRWAREELGNYTGEVVGAHLVYDLDWLATENVHLNKVSAFHDVQLAEPLINDQKLSYTLESICREYLDEGKVEGVLREAAAAYGWHTNKEVKKNLWKLPAAYAGEYGEGDADQPLKVFAKQRVLLHQLELEEVYSVERRLIPVLLAMRLRGVRVDLDQAQRARSILLKERAKWVAHVKRLAGPKAELLQPLSLAPALRDRGLDVPATPKTGQPSITKAFFERHRGDELVDAIAAGRRVDTLINTFIDGHVLGHHVRGRLHCEYNQLKNERGGTPARLSSANPNLQNIPSREGIVDDLLEFDEAIVKLIRGIFVAEVGEKWQRDDYSQIEYRLLVHYAVGQGAEAARQKYRDDPKTDYHKLVAEMLGVDPEDKVKRKRVKNTNFAKGYGAQAKKLSETFGCSVEEAQRFVDEYDAKLPFAKRTYEKAMEWGERRGFVVTILNRRAQFPYWEPRGNRPPHKQPALPREQALKKYGPRIQRADTYKALNRKLQGSGGDLMKKAMVDGWEAGLCEPDALGPYLVTVHDELGSSVPPTPRGDEAGRELTQLMENAVKLRVPVLVESERGDNWGEVS